MGAFAWSGATRTAVTVLSLDYVRHNAVARRSSDIRTVAPE